MRPFSTDSPVRRNAPVGRTVGADRDVALSEVEKEERLAGEERLPTNGLPEPMETYETSQIENDASFNPTEQAIARIWSEVLRVEDIGKDENFFDLGGHSLLAIRVMARVRKALGVNVPLNIILERPTISEFAQAVSAMVDAPAETNQPHRLVPIQTAGTRLPLFWIPGGRAISVLAFREVSLLLGPDQPVYGLESKLPEEGEEFTSVPERAKHYIELIRALQPVGPYLLAGFCMGGMVAFEMAQQLREQGEQIGFLALMQAWTPGFPRTKWERRRMETQRRLFFLQAFSQFLWIRVAPKPLSPPRQKKQDILDRISKLLLGWVGTSAQLPDDTQTANISAMRNYLPDTYAGDVDLFLAEDCYESAGLDPEIDPRLSWRHLISGECRVHRLPGDHSSMLANPHAKKLAEELTRCMSDV